MTTSTDAVPSTWAPDRIWLQREQGDHGSHTWCEDSVGDGDIIEEVEYVRADRAKVQADHIADERKMVAGEVQAEAVQSAWIDVAAELPRSEWDKYYHDDFSAPVAVMIAYKGHVRLSEITWRYSFAHGGWVHADLDDGWKPDDYSDCGRVTHWAPLPEPLYAAPQSSQPAQSETAANPAPSEVSRDQ